MRALARGRRRLALLDSEAGAVEGGGLRVVLVFVSVCVINIR